MTVLQMIDTDAESQVPQKKRRLSSRLHNEDTRQSVEAWLTSVNHETNSFQMPAAPDTMVNSFGLNDPFHQTHLQRTPEENGYCDGLSPIAPLLNLGNTCFLNSVLYTLRFAPSFLHKLHHLNFDSEIFTKQMQANKDRAYSLGRNVGKSVSYTKDSSYGPSCSEVKTQAVISKLHQVYTSLCINELKDRMEPFQPNFFLHALRDVNPIFEGNQQHDAHELLVCLVDIFREACEFVYQQNNYIERITPPSSATSTSSAIKSVVRKSLKFSKIMRSEKRTNCLRENHSEGDIKKYLINGNSENKDDSNVVYPEDRHISSPNTLFDDFRGISLLRTTCLECEQVTERKETFCDICVPIQTTDNYNVEAVNKLYQSIIVTEEYLMDCNKYWCERCSRYNEAKRCVKFEKLPRLLTLHLKRFSSGFGSSVSKVNDHMPTPFLLPCFCEECLEIERTNERPHYYTLYAIIMHIGSSIASGHYVAYVKTYENAQDYLFCAKDKPKTSSLSRGSSINTVSTNSNNMLDKTTGISKYFMKLSSKSFNGSSANMNSKESEVRNRVVSSCKGIDCCSVRSRNSFDVDLNTSSVWLECDDETVRVLSQDELEEMLSPTSSKNGSVTPYLLFYSKVDS